MGQGLLMDLD